MTTPETVGALIERLEKQQQQYRRSLEDCRMLAARHAHKTGAEWAEHILRFCAAAGVVGSPLRAPLIACNAELELDKDGRPVARRPNKPQGSA